MALCIKPSIPGSVTTSSVGLTSATRCQGIVIVSPRLCLYVSVGDVPGLLHKVTVNGGIVIDLSQRSHVGYSNCYIR